MEDDFTIKGYKQLLKAGLDSGYRFMSFNDELRFECEMVCLLRHDIDADLGYALQLAELEAEMGIKSTLFLMLRSPLYNLFARSNHQMVERIISIGHWIGLHFDGNFNMCSTSDLNRLIKREVKVIKEMFGVDIGAVSFHQPSKEVISGQIQIKDLVNTYNHKDMRGFIYISDSNKKWLDIPPYEIFKRQIYPKVHLLIHPMWWMHDYPNLSPEKVWGKVILSNFTRSQQQLIETERAYGKPKEIILKQGER